MKCRNLFSLLFETVFSDYFMLKKHSIPDACNSHIYQGWI